MHEEGTVGVASRGGDVMNIIPVSVTLYNSSGVFHNDERWSQQQLDDATKNLTPLEKSYLMDKGLSVRIKKSVYIRVGEPVQ